MSQGGRLDEVIALAERNASCVEKAHEDALSYRLVSEQQLLGEIHQWRHRHPQVERTQLIRFFNFVTCMAIFLDVRSIGAVGHECTCSSAWL